MQRAMQVQSPCTKIPMDAAGGDARVLEVHGAQAHGRWGGCSVMLFVVRAVLAILWCLWGEGSAGGGGDSHASADIACDEPGTECAPACEGGNEGETGWVT